MFTANGVGSNRPRALTRAALVPDLEALGVELHVHLQNGPGLLAGGLAAVFGNLPEKHVHQGLPQLFGVLPVPQAFPDFYLPVDESVQFGAQALDVLHRTEVCQVHSVGLVTQEPVDRPVHRLGVKLNRRGRRKDEGPPRRIQGSIRQSKGIAGEEA